MKPSKISIEKLLDSRTLELENKIKELNFEIEERRRVEEVLNKQNCILALNENIASSYTKSSSLQNMLKKCVEAMVKHLDIAFARIWTLSKDVDMLELQASAGMYTHINGPHSRVPVGNLKIGLIAHERKPHLTNSIDDDPRINDKEWAKREGIVAFAGYPLITEDRLAGVIGMFSRRILTNDILEIIASVAPEIALIIERKKSEELLKNLNESLEKRVSERTEELAKRNEALLQSEKLGALGVMTSGVAHEFNNILAIIKGYAQLLELKFAGSGEFKEGLHTISKASDDGALLVRRMKEFIANDGNTIWFESVDINDLIEQTVNYLKPKWNVMARVSGVDYHLDLKGLKKVPFVKACSPDLREVFINIINNAFDAMPHGGTVCFMTWFQDGKVFASISDTGKGMSKDVQKKIFDPFFTTRMPEGTGLGMSAVYGIIKKLKGEIEVESELGKGSTITLGFPVATETTPKIALPRPVLDPKNGNLRILVVDDETEICGLLQDFFTEKGYIVWSVNSGNEAIKLLKCKSFDLVLCDLIMPDGTGRDVIKMVNTLDKRPKIGLITGWSEKIDTSNDDNLKTDFVIHKPFDFSELSKHINKMFNPASQNH